MENNVIAAVLILANVIDVLILIRIILEIFRMPYNVFVNFIYSVTDPILGPARALLQKVFRGRMMIDFSPILVYLVIDNIIVPVIINLVHYIF